MSSNRLDQIRESLRLQQVYNVFIRYGIEMVLDRGVLGDFRRRMQKFIFDLPSIEPLTLPVKVRLMIQELGPTYVKMGQLISSQAEVLPEEWKAELVKLQNDVPPFSYLEVYNTIVEELGDAPEVIYAEFDREPMAAASTAQVHRATLHSGEQVVVKVQRPNIRTQVAADLAIMQRAGTVVVRRSQWARELNLLGVLNEFGANVLLELDYNNEMYNSMRLAKNMTEISGIHLPIIYPALSTSRIITMEFIDGVKISSVEQIRAAGHDTVEIANRVLRAMIKQLLIDGFFHADPHPGNVFFNLETGIVTMLDTGMVGELELEKRMGLISLLGVLSQRDIHGIAQTLLGLSQKTRPLDEKAYYRDFERRVGRVIEYELSSSMAEDVNLMFSILRKHGLQLDAQLTLAIKALMQAEAVAKTMYAGTGIVEQANEIIKELILAQITSDNITRVVKKEATIALRDVSQRLPTLREATLKWLTQYEKGRLELHVDTSDLTREMAKTRQLAIWAVLGLVVAGMIVGSAIAATAPVTAEAYWSYMPRLALVGYTLAMLVAFGIILLLIWNLLRNRNN